ncbi:DNA cytosine methyltransferase, partial [Klebsiella pneumoniae subsp. pneumoniae]
LIAAHLTRFNTGATGSSLDAPAPTVTANSYIKREGGAAPLGIVAAHVTRQFGASVGSDCGEPIGTITAGGAGKAAVVAAFLDSYYGNGEGWDVSRPMPTDTTRDRSSLVTLIAAHLTRFNTGATGSSLDAPAPTVTANSYIKR